jgi:hypothetical protein
MRPQVKIPPMTNPTQRAIRRPATAGKTDRQCKTWRTTHGNDPTVRDLYQPMRDAWIAMADRWEFLDDAVMPPSAGERSSHHELLPQMPFGDRYRRGYCPVLLLAGHWKNGR